jgi:TolB-like protein
VAQVSGSEQAKETNEKSIAVLPSANMSVDAENQYFSDGLAEELINAFTRLPGLRVASRTSGFGSAEATSIFDRSVGICRSRRSSKGASAAPAAACV